jgi:hypothetical protein
LGNLDVGGRTVPNILIDKKNVAWIREAQDGGLYTIMGPCEHSIQTSRSIKDGKFFD